MAGTLRLYRPVKDQPKSFKGVKSITVPNQSMTLKEILRRFIRREALPIEKQGTYETRMGDLEKLAQQDITVQMERVQEIKENLARAKARMDMKAEDEKRAALKKELEEQQKQQQQPPPTPSGS